MGPIYYILIALPCTIGAMTLAVLHIYKHLLNYTEPTYQRYIVRIIFMVPVAVQALSQEEERFGAAVSGRETSAYHGEE
ncbi:hypothetical protein SASPL_120281 [Salvia splendens]|uniref:Uncharacterized protein n=1 Tax=Salvia splendens TaxID=180675 RepID=A0A8X8ZTU3_SALSN|nr:hypothetical protein SASPL_120281 [Salvia splendens]